MRNALGLGLVLMLAIAGAALAAQTRYHDFGALDDVSENSEVRLWPRESLRIGTDPNEYIQYESTKKFYWATTPPRTKGLIASRVVQAGHPVEIRVDAFSRTPGELYLEVRFKDHLASPASVSMWTTDGWLRVGELGGAFDHMWKSAVLAAPAGRAASADGYYRFRLGAEDGRDLVGEVPIDYVRVSDSPVASEPAERGFFPEPRASTWASLLSQGHYPPDGAPAVPVGLMVTGARTETWKQVADLGVPMVSLIGWNNDWRAKWEVRSDGRFVDRVEAGLPDWLEMAGQHGLRHVPAFNTDNLAWFIRNVYKGENATLAAVRSAIRANRSSRALLAWIMKTRTDADAPGEGCPLEYAVLLGNLRSKNDANHPTVMLFDGEKPGAYRYYADATDVVAVDRYPFAEGRPLSWLGEAVSEARRQVGGEKALWAVVEAYTESGEKRLGRQLTPREVQAQAYTALANGATGVWFFIGSGGGYVDIADIPEPMEGVRRVARELGGGRSAIAKCFLPPFETADVNGERGVLTTTNPAIHHILKKGPGATYYLIAVNTSPDRQAGVRFESPKLIAGGTVIVPFEERVIASTPGALTDDFAPYQRHVYRFLTH